MTVTRVKTTAGWLDLNTTGPKGDKGDPGYYEYSYIAGTAATAVAKDLSTPAGTWGNLAIPTTPVNINQPAGAFVVNANGSMTVRDAGLYDIETSVLASSAWVTANIRMVTGLGVGATAVAAAEGIARADSTVSVASGYPSVTLAGIYYLAAGSIIWVTYLGQASSGSAACQHFSIARIGAGPPGPTGAQGPTGATGATGGNATVPMDTWHYIGTTGEPAFMNNWGHTAASSHARFRKFPDGKVRLAGQIKTGFFGTVAFILPAAYCPAQNVIAPAAYENTGFAQTAAEVDIATTGHVTPNATATGVAPGLYLSLDGVEFDTETVTAMPTGPAGGAGVAGGGRGGGGPQRMGVCGGDTLSAFANPR